MRARPERRRAVNHPKSDLVNRFRVSGPEIHAVRAVLGFRRESPERAEQIAVQLFAAGISLELGGRSDDRVYAREFDRETGLAAISPSGAVRSLTEIREDSSGRLHVKVRFQGGGYDENAKAIAASNFMLGNASRVFTRGHGNVIRFGVPASELSGEPSEDGLPDVIISGEDGWVDLFVSPITGTWMVSGEDSALEGRHSDPAENGREVVRHYSTLPGMVADLRDPAIASDVITDVLHFALEAYGEDPEELIEQALDNFHMPRPPKIGHK